MEGLTLYMFRMEGLTLYMFRMEGLTLYLCRMEVSGIGPRINLNPQEEQGSVSLCTGKEDHPSTNMDLA